MYVRVFITRFTSGVVNRVHARILQFARGNEKIIQDLKLYSSENTKYLESSRGP